MRLHELAKALGISTKEAADRLAALGHEVKPNPQVAVPEAALRVLREQHPDLPRDGGARPKAPAKPKKPPAPPPPPEPAGPKRRIIKRAEDVALRLQESILGVGAKVQSRNGLPRAHRLILGDLSQVELA